MPKGVHDNHLRASATDRWRPGGKLATNGYVKVRVGKSHPLADPNGYAYEHHVVWCAAGRSKPPRGWVIHHRNHDKTDNRLENLEAKPRGRHNAEHLCEDNRRCPASGRFLSKRVTGRHLDGVTHDAMPTVAV